jgi:hypothetical protein
MRADWYWQFTALSNYRRNIACLAKKSFVTEEADASPNSAVQVRTISQS